LIGETGFGTGLNFFVTWKLWREISLPECDLVYHSVERYPLTIEQIVRSISQWPELNPLLEQFKDQYVSLGDTSKIISLDDGNVSLKILIGDATKMLSGVKFAADAWFLDGFAPSRNPDMWSPELFREIARLSKTGTRLATFTAASAVRKGLTEVGFEMKKNVGFSGKREMLIGVKN
jgi:tRNA 5-methylaminomethyl-2-thiouridine biosynthesis bifunctional protein